MRRASCSAAFRRARESQASCQGRRPRRQAAHAPAIDDATTAALSAHAVALSGGRNSPAVRRLLSEHKLHAADIRGSGAGGRITVDDVLEHVAQETATSVAAAARAAGALRSLPDRCDACRTRRSASASPSGWSRACCTRRRTSRRSSKLDLGAVLAHRAQHRADFEQRGASLTLTAYFLAACVDAIREVPEVNSRWTDDALEIYDNHRHRRRHGGRGQRPGRSRGPRGRSRWTCSASRARCPIWSRARAKTSSRRRTCAAGRSRSPITASAAAWSRRRSSSISRSRRFSASASWRSGRSSSTTTARTRSSCSRAAT